jgi:hypothetical protein
MSMTPTRHKPPGLRCICGHGEEQHQQGRACEGTAYAWLDDTDVEGPCECLEYVWDESTWQVAEYQRTGIVWS